MAGRRAGFGQITKLPSGRYRARYQVAGVVPRRYVNAPTTFARKTDAQDWLAAQRTLIVQGVIRPTALASKITLAEYAERWLSTRRSSTGEPLRPSTARTYRHYLDRHILPALGAKTLPSITRAGVDAWYSALLPDRPTLRARTYALLKTILSSAVDEELLAVNPCRVRGGSLVRPATHPVVLTPLEIRLLADQMPERLRAAILLGAWCQLRSGELLELRRRDVSHGTVTIARGVTWVDGRPIVGRPKTDAGVRAVALPPHIGADLADHLDRFANPGQNGLLFAARPGVDRQIYGPTFADTFKRAARRAELPGTLRFHHLRHAGLTLLAQSGATLAELQARAGHATPGIAMRYQHAVATRDHEIARALSMLAEESEAAAQAPFLALRR
ncbi:integrase [Actinotalea ferrariae CF5-4]|uniref:Integrase n=1 Tax=Actinotalea ferrariae CF5-4 TaxID=948458 RepID=A0A021VS22_9CELL|nr:site-specific integrase [Actinotalea ferrariae]EYR61847.1 integrase [Actinotalea ferrariae CF5-4]